MKNSRYLILVFCGLLLFSCTGNKYIVERTPKHNNPVDEISWLKKRKKEFEKRECQITLYEKDGKNYYAVFATTPGAFDKNTTVVYDQEGNICLKFGGLMPPPKREAVKKFFENAVVEQKHKITESTGLIEKYKTQLDNVRNNREFDNLSKEIEFQGLEIEFSEKKIREFGEAIVQKKAEIAELTERLDGRKADLTLKQSELEQIISETKQDEEKLREKAKKLEANIEPRLLTAFKRIRKGARNGLAVVYIQRDACGGCFNKIPPQKQMDIKLRKKIIVCEYCGRIMIDPELAGIEE